MNIRRSGIKRCVDFDFGLIFVDKVFRRDNVHFRPWREIHRKSGLLFSLHRAQTNGIVEQLERRGVLKTSRDGVDVLQ